MADSSEALPRVITPAICLIPCKSDLLRLGIPYTSYASFLDCNDIVQNTCAFRLAIVLLYCIADTVGVLIASSGRNSSHSKQQQNESMTVCSKSDTSSTTLVMARSATMAEARAV